MTTTTPPNLSRSARDSGLVIISITGQLDTAGTQAIEPAFKAALPDRTVRAIVELSGVPFLTSAALAMFIVNAQAMHRAGGKFCLAAPQKVVADIFVQAGFTSAFPIYDTLDKAIEEMEEDIPSPPRFFSRFFTRRR
ncbi:MAG: STAS domain-containing protein [Anaerolineae bacterium]|nr:STAS domain-containing protein [Anaerolineae bacterium]